MTSTPYLIASKKFFKLSETCSTIETGNDYSGLISKAADQIPLPVEPVALNLSRAAHPQITVCLDHAFPPVAVKL